LGDTFAGEHEYSGYSTERHLTEIPMSYLVDTEGETQDLILNKIGTGRLYYRLGLKYAPTDLVLEPLEMGFVVQREMGFVVQRVYEAVDDPEDVTRQDDGTWVIKAGARVRVRLTDGVFEYTYIARATTPGVFVVPPAKAEEMYSPEVFGRSGSDKVIVE